MGKSTNVVVGATGSGGGTGGILGPRNKIIVFTGINPHDTNASGDWNSISDQVSVWTKPANINPDVPVKVWVWGAGGNSGHNGHNSAGGGGGLAIKEIPVASIGTTETITVGHPTHQNPSSRGTVTSFGSHCSATAANNGGNTSNPSGNPNATGENSNPQTSVNSGYGQGGIGIGGDINRRGGQGGWGNSNPGSGYSGGGGSAPNPQGHRDGFRGGCTSMPHSGAGGASINFQGPSPYTHYTACGGSGTAQRGSSNSFYDSNRSFGGVGGAGLMGAGGRGGMSGRWSNNDNMRPGIDASEDGKGSAIWDPNLLFFGGGGGGGGYCLEGSSGRANGTAANGGPGAGGGTGCQYNSSDFGRPGLPGNGGVLGGGGGNTPYQTSSNGGSAGGGGGNAWDGECRMWNGVYGVGGCGIVVLTYAVT